MQQKFIYNLEANLSAIKQNNSFIVDIKYLQKLLDSILAYNAVLLKKLDNISEFDTTINFKRKLQVYQIKFRNFILNDLPKFIVLLNSSNQYKYTAAMNLLAKDAVLLRKKADEFKNAEDEFFDKYSLH